MDLDKHKLSCFEFAVSDALEDKKVFSFPCPDILFEAIEKKCSSDYLPLEVSFAYFMCGVFSQFISSDALTETYISHFNRKVE